MIARVPMTTYARIILLLAVAGLIVAGLLTSFHYSEAAEGRFCSAAAGCSTVNTSVYSTVYGIPVAVLGLAGYASIAALALLSRQRADIRRWLALAVFGVSLVGVLYSAYLTYLELYVIHAICPWCVLSAALMTVIFLATLRELRRRDATPSRARSSAT